MISQNRPEQWRSTKRRAVSSFVVACLVALCVFGPASQPASGLAAAGVATVPNAPTMASVTPADHGAIARWNAPDSDGGSPITGYQATADPGGATCTTTVGVDTDPLTCVIHGLDPGQTYVVTVQAINAVGTSTASATWGRLSSTFKISGNFVDTGIDLTNHSATDVSASGQIWWSGPVLPQNYGDPIPPSGWSTFPADATPCDWDVTLMCNSQGVVDPTFHPCSVDIGDPTNWHHFVLPSEPCYSLIGRIGSKGKPFYVGSLNWVTSTGRLFLGINTCPTCSNVGGDVFVTTVTYDKYFSVVPLSPPTMPTGVQPETGPPGAAALFISAAASDPGAPVTGYQVTTTSSTGACRMIGLAAYCSGLQPGKPVDVAIAAFNQLGVSSPATFTVIPAAKGQVRFDHVTRSPGRMYRGGRVTASAVVVYRWSDGHWGPMPNSPVRLQVIAGRSWHTVSSGSASALGKVALSASTTGSLVRQMYRLQTDSGASANIPVTVDQPTNVFRLINFDVSDTQVQRGDSD